MADVQEYAARLAQTIGPRPAGTEEEQQASFVIEEVLQREASLNVQSEEFNCNPNYELPRIICCIVSLVLVVLSIFLPLVQIPALIICLITAALFILEMLGISPLTRTAKRGVSQNVIGKYTPLQNGEQSPVTRRRKVVLIARYDTGKVSRELSGPLFGALNIIHWIELGAMVLIPIALLVLILAGSTPGPVVIFGDVLAVIGAVGAALPVISFILHQTAPFNDGANCNAAGVAVMLEVAKRVGLGLYDQDVEDEVVVHGEEAAREEGLLPEDAEVEYASSSEPSATNAMPPLDLSAEIEAAQAARAARAEDAELAALAAPASDAAAVPAAATAATAAPAMPLPEAPTQAVPEGALANAASVMAAASGGQQSDVPDWYRRARERANRSATDSVPVHRSRFAEAMDAAAAAREVEAARMAEEQQQGQVSEVERRLAAMRASIMGEAAAEPQGHAPSGIDGFLASTTEAPDYATASASLDDLEAAATSETKQAGDVADRILSHQTPQQRAAQARAQQAQPAQVTAPAQAQAQAPADTAVSAASTQQAAAEPQAAVAPHKAAAKQEHRPRRSISLPSLTGAIQAVNQKQEPASGQEQSEPVLADAQRRERQSALSASIPSLDPTPARANAAHQDMEEDEPISVSQAGSFTVGGATGAFEPVGDELLADMDPDDVYVDDADDSDYDDGFTAAGAMTGAGYVNMPASRKSRVFGKFRRNKKEEEQSFSEAFGLEEDFDARKVGKKRGGWESFQNQSAEFDDAWEEDDEWNGGAFSKERLGAAFSRVKPGSSDGEGRSARRSRSGDESDEAPRTRFAGTERDEHAGLSDTQRNLHPFADIPLKGLGEEREAVQEFRSGPINMEIWFVALGAELADNAGMKALIAEHGAELKGAMMIDLDALGAGELSLIEREGMFRPVKLSSRMKRYVRKASAALGLSVGKGTMLWRNSAATLAARHGYQTLHLVGLSGGKPAYLGQADDVVDNLSEDIMQDNADFVMELIRAI